MRYLIVTLQLPVLVVQEPKSPSPRHELLGPKLELKPALDRYHGGLVSGNAYDHYNIPRSKSILMNQQESSGNSSSSLDSFSNFPINNFERNDVKIEYNFNHEILASITGTVETPVVWIGDLAKEEKYSKAIQERLANQFNCILVKDKEGASSGHLKYCRRILSPIFHNMLPDYHLANYNAADWTAYVEYNRAVADTIIQVYQKGDLVWINDFHLFLVPKMIKERIKDASIGLFLHAPFPTSEIFRCLPSKISILEGMLGSDLIGFQAYSYARHFLAGCTQILGLESADGGIQVERDRIVKIIVSPIGINARLLQKQQSSPCSREAINSLKIKFSGQKIIFACDPGNILGGVEQKIKAFKIFLANFPEWRGRVRLFQILQHVSRNDKMYKLLVSLAADVNRRFGSIEYTPVVLTLDTPPVEMYALMTIADVCLNTVLRDGMSLTGHAFIMSQQENRGPLILSEFSGAAIILDAAIKVNPWDSLEVCNALNDALRMSLEERTARQASLESKVLSLSASEWAMSILTELNNINVERMTKLNLSVPLMNFETFKKSYKEAVKSLLLIDYDSMVPPFRNIPYSLSSVKALCLALKHLTEAHPFNKIVLISSRTAEQLEHTLAGIPVIVCAEDGLSWRTTVAGEWCDLISVPAFWPKLAMIFDYWTERTPGAWLETKRGSFVWHYSAAGAFGARQAKECHTHVQDAIGSSYPVHVIVGNQKLQVKLRVLNQVQAIVSMLRMHFNSSIDHLGIFTSPKGDYNLFQSCSEAVAQRSAAASLTCRQSVFITSIGNPLQMHSNTIPLYRLADSSALNQLLLLL